jgi:hypothetical protein
MRMLKDGSDLCEDFRIGDPVFTIFFREAYYTRLVNGVHAAPSTGQVRHVLAERAVPLPGYLRAQ